MEIKEENLNELMSKIDEFLSDQNVPIHARPVRATVEFMKEIGVSGPIAGPSLKPVGNPITPLNLANHINRWYQQRYAKKLKVDFTQAKFPFLIKGDVFEVRVPLFSGQIIVAVMRNKKINSGVLNPLDMVNDLTEYLRASISDSDMALLQAYFETCLGTSLIISKIRDNDLLSSAYKDSFVSCENLTTNPRSPELSSWHAVQFAEKTLKYFISSKKETFPKTHIFCKLVALAKDLGYVPDPRINWDLLSSVTPSVRYESGQIPLKNAVSINLEAWRVGYNILHQVKA